MKLSDGPFTTPNGITLLVLFIIAAIVYLLLTGCAAAEPGICDQVRAGGMVQDGPDTMTVIVNREVVATGVPIATILECRP